VQLPAYATASHPSHRHSALSMLEIIFQFSIFRFEIPISCIAVCFVALIPPRPLFYSCFLVFVLFLFYGFFSTFPHHSSEFSVLHAL